MDAPEDSARFARDLEFPFPMLSDPGGAVGRQYVGFNTDDDTDIPGIVIVRDGRVAFRQIATTKYDRLTAPQLLAQIDASLGTSGPAGVHVTPLDDIQLRVDAGGGARDGACDNAMLRDTCAIATLSAAALVPLGHHVLVGPWLAYTGGRADVDGAALLRLPIYGEAGAIEVGATVGGGTRFNAAARADLWFAWARHYSLTIGAAYRVDSGDRDVVFTLGVGRLFGR